MAPGKSSQAQTMLKRKFELLDPDILECPICAEDLAPPVYQCPTGHTMCAGCWGKINSKKCPSCQKPIGNTRCIGVEKILESLLVSCKYILYGCHEMFRYTKIAEHETTFCEHQPFNCPFHVCKFKASTQNLSLHIQYNHKVQTVQHTDHFTMTPTDDYVIVVGRDYRSFLVHREKQSPLGDKFFCACLGTFPGRLKLEVNVKDGTRDSYTLKTQGRDIRKGDEWKRNFLLVPQSSHGLENCEFQGQLDIHVPGIKRIRFAQRFDD